MTQRNKQRPALVIRRSQVGFRGLTAFLTPLLIFFLSAVTPSSKAHCRTGELIRQSTQEPTGAGKGKDIQTLEPGKPIRRELAGGQQHCYQIRLSAGQFLKATIEQQGIDVVVQVSGPDGNQMTEFDSDSRPQGEEQVSLVAEMTGEYRLTVRPKQNGAAASPYQIRIEELRAATEQDRALHDARKQFEEALKLKGAGKYDEALSSVELVLEVRERLLGAEHRDVAAAIDSLADIYTKRGEYLKAEPLHRRALAIREKALGQDHPDTGASLDNLAELYYYQGKYVEAEQLFKRALAIREKALGQDHPDTAASLDNLATLYAAKGDIAQAVKFQLRANATSERNLARNLVIGSERQKLAYLATLSAQTDRTISLHLHSAPDDPMARALAATLILQRKGRALDATSQNLNALRSRFNAEDQALLDRLTETRSQIARLVLRGPQKMTIEQHQDQIKELEDQADKDESAISRRSDEFRAQYLPVTLEAVMEAIPPDSALIEFASYRPFNAKATKGDEAYGPPRYVAYVLRREGEIEWKELGEAKSIDTAIASLRKASRDPKRVDVNRLARAVDARVFQPLRPLLGDVRRLLISPDGSLNLIPFAAFVDERGRYAVERYSISYLASGRDLLRLQVARESKNGPLLVAAPDFGRRSQVEVARSGEQEKYSSEGEVKEEAARSAIKEFYFPPLPYAAQEGEALRVLLPDATLLTKGQATKAALGQVRSPELLHIATHSFFLEDQQLTSAGERGAQALTDDPERALQLLEARGVRIDGPLLRSGLALAGVNEHKDDDNGILTALEVTGLNLWGTKLVALSACDTGVGEVKNGDGVHGLRRALVLAGAETQVMSLWAVSDKATRELMVAYYGRFKQGQGRGEALRQVQLEMLKNVNRRHPYYWASFIQSGEWANLEGKR
jgi:CHAT domain-containing protein